MIVNKREEESCYCAKGAEHRAKLHVAACDQKHQQQQ